MGDGQRDLAPVVTGEDLAVIVARCWSGVLEGVEVGVDDDVFELGAHSLLIGRVALALRRSHGVDVPFALFFEHPTPRTLAAAVSSARGGA